MDDDGRISNSLLHTSAPPNPACPTALWVRGNMEGKGEREISSPPSLSVTEYFVRTASQKPVSSLQ